LLEPRPTAEKALGVSGVSKSEVSRLCEELDERVGAFLICDSRRALDPAEEKRAAQRRPKSETRCS
jgi:hypothetical protein